MSRFVCLALFVAMLSMSGCAGQSTKQFVWQSGDAEMVWPSEPDKPRIRYLRDITGPSDFKDSDSKGGFLAWMFGELDEDLPLLTPFAVAVDLDETVWVADNGARMLYRFDVNRKELLYYQQIGGIYLNTPSGVAVDTSSQRVFLSDAGLAKVFVLDSKGNYLDTWAPQEGFKRPAGLAVNDQGHLLVADAMAGIVYVFDAEGGVVGRIKSKLSPDGLFRRPLNVALGPNGEVVILDAMAFRVEIHDSQGELLGSIGEVGDGAGYLARPKGLAVDRMGHIFVSDAAFDNIQVFDMAGNLLMYLGEAGTGAGQFNLPAGLFADHKDRLFATDSYNHRVQVFSLLH